MKTISRFEHAINEHINKHYQPVDMNYRVLTREEEQRQRIALLEEKAKKIINRNTSGN